MALRRVSAALLVGLLVSSVVAPAALAQSTDGPTFAGDGVAAVTNEYGSETAEFELTVAEGGDARLRVTPDRAFPFEFDLRAVVSDADDDGSITVRIHPTRFGRAPTDRYVTVGDGDEVADVSLPADNWPYHTPVVDLLYDVELGVPGGETTAEGRIEAGEIWVDPYFETRTITASPDEVVELRARYRDVPRREPGVRYVIGDAESGWALNATVVDADGDRNTTLSVDLAAVGEAPPEAYLDVSAGDELQDVTLRDAREEPRSASERQVPIALYSIRGPGQGAGAQDVGTISVRNASATSSPTPTTTATPTPAVTATPTPATTDAPAAGSTPTVTPSSASTPTATPPSTGARVPGFTAATVAVAVAALVALSRRRRP